MPEAPVTVEYRDVVGFPGYKVGSDATLWSCWTSSRKFTENWKQLTLCPDRRGYPIAQMRLDRKLRHMQIAVVLLTAFVGPCPEGMEACHEDGNPRNNELGNLRWDTHVANMADRKRHGRGTEGEKSHSAKMTEKDVINARARSAAGELVQDIAKDFGIHPATMSRLLRGELWSHLPNATPRRPTDSSARTRWDRWRERSPRGKVNVPRKLTDEQVLEIRARFAAGETNKSALAREYGVVHGTIRQILSGKCWRHLLEIRA